MHSDAQKELDYWKNRAATSLKGELANIKRIGTDGPNGSPEDDMLMQQCCGYLWCVLDDED